MQEKLIGFRLSPQQERLWKLQQELDGFPYRAQCAVWIDGPLDTARLQASLTEVVERHEILRSSLRRLPGMTLPVQIVNDRSTVAIELQDATGWRVEEREALLAGVFDSLALSGFDYEQGPVLRVHLVFLEPGLHMLLVSSSALHLDSRALENFLNELRRSYSGGLPPDEPMQYADLAEWQNEILEAADEGGRAFWRVQQPMMGRPSLPEERRAPEREGFAPVSATRTLEPYRMAQIEDLARLHAVTAETVLLCLWQALLYRLTGDAEQVTAVACDGRHYEGLGEVLGLFERYLPLRTQLEPELPLTRVFQRTHQALQEIRGWQEHFSWLGVADAEGGVQSPSFQPFCFSFEPEWKLPPAANVSFRPWRRTACTERFVVRLACQRQDGGLILEVSCDGLRFDSSSIARLLERFGQLLDSVLSSPAEPLLKLDVIGAAEREWLISEVNQTRSEYPEACSVHDLIAGQARRTPEAAAVRWSGGEITYDELLARSHALAGHLRLLGVQPETVVGVLLDRTPEMITALLAIWEAGGAYLPLDASYPRERLAFMLKDARVGLVLSQKGLRPLVPELGIPVLDLEEAGDHSGDIQPSGPSDGASGGEGLAYVIYTSGSTGRPKGVMISHRALVNYLQWGSRAYAVADGDGALVHSPLGFDLTVTSLFTPLLVGGVVNLLPEEPGVEGLRSTLLSRGGWSLLKMTPAHLRLLSQQSSESVAGSARVVVIGGEALFADDLLEWRANAPWVRLINEYGPTETVVGCCIHEVSPASPWSGPVPIGKPIANTLVYLLDASLRLVPFGMSGELYVGGAGVARGYLDRPDLTAERFIPNPFGAAGGRLYKTGDLARWLPESELEFLGRLDDQVKIRGFRVELGEIEGVLGSHPHLKGVAVIALERSAAEKYLAAYVVPAQAAPSEADLRSFLRSRLPEYMIPNAWVFLEELPLTSNGKVDRRALPMPEAREGGHGVAPALAPVEEILIGIWSSVLRREGIGIHDNFFDIGGHSLLATQVTAHVKDILQVDIPLRALFEAPTIRELGRVIERTMRVSQRLEEPPLVAVPRDRDLPLSFAQQRLFFLENLTPGTTLYHIPVANRIEGHLEVPVLERSFSELVRRHEILRTVFSSTSAGEVQVIHPALPLALPVIDLSALPEAVRLAEARALTLQEAVRLFDLSRGPLLRVSLVRLGAEEHVVLVTMHHIVSDGWSVGVLVRELATHIETFSSGRPSPLPELPLQYADFSCWQRQWLQGEVLEEQLAYWRQHLGESPLPLELPTDRPRSAIRSWRGQAVPIWIPQALAQPLRSLSRAHGTTLFMTLLSGLSVLLSRYSGQSRVIVGTPIANRTRAELEGLIGFFVNTLALGVDVGRSFSFRDLLVYIREVTLEAYTHQDLPFEMLVESLQLHRDLSRPPLFQVMFALQNAPVEELSVPGLRLVTLDTNAGAAKFEWTISMAETSTEILGALEYASDLFDRATVVRVVGHLENLLAALVQEPDRALAELELLTEAEKRHVLEAGSAVEEFGQELCLHHLFQRQARLRPDAEAVVLGEDRWSYAQLDRRSNALAERLREIGVGPEVRVAICLERTPAIPLAILAVFKAGGAYVPLDPDYPKERLDFMLRDSGARVLITDPHLVDRLPDFDGALVSVDRFDSELDSVPPGGPLADHAAYVIYTSGSTGTPKGVVVTHRNVARLFAAGEESIGFYPSDVWTLFHSFAFDFSVWEIWGALLHGGRLVVVPYLVSRSPDDLLDLLENERVTVLNQTPSAFRQLIHATGQRPRNLSLRRVIFGGEALDLPRLRPWFDLMGDEQPLLVNMYGITETTVHVTYRPVRMIDLALGSVIGRPLPDLSLHLLDSFLRLSPIGVPGEIHVGGAGLARGYLNRPDLTAARFIPDVFSGIPGARLYRSGDLARWLANGDIEYLGRADNQVKVRGFRIELGEIEAALSSHSDIRECVVIASHDGSAEVRLIAYFTPTEESAPAVGELRAFLHAKLPQYAVPSAFIALDRLPLTAHGKLDREALPAPEPVRPELESGYVAPRTPVERHLAEIWSETLGIEQVGVRDNFLELGGDSIRSIRVIAMARERGIELTLQQLFQHQTIEALAQVALLRDEASLSSGLRTSQFSLISDEDTAKLPYDVEDAYPLTALQAGMLFHMALNPDLPTYHNVDSFLLQYPFRPQAFEQAVQAVIDRHPVLRTSFDFIHYGEPLQLVHRFAPAPVWVVDLRGISRAEQDQAVDELIAREGVRHFDLGDSPQLRFHIHRRTDDTFQLTITENHAILDGWSLHSMLAEIFENLEAALAGRPLPERPVLPAALREFVYLERQALQSEAAERYWTRALEGVTLAELPRWSEAAIRSRGQRITNLRVFISKEVSQGLTDLARSTEVPVKTVLLAAHLKVLGLLSGRTDVLTGLTIHGRPEELEGERALGFFLNTLPVRLEVSGSTWLDLVNRTFAVEQELLPLRRYPLTALQQKFGSQQMFDTLFNYVQFHVVRDMLANSGVRSLEFKKIEENNFRLTSGFHLDAISSEIGLELNCDSTYLSGPQIQLIGSYFARVLTTLATDPHGSHELLLLSRAEQQQILLEWNDTATSYPTDLSIPQVFSRRAELSPEAPAVISTEEGLTYAEFEDRSNRLANHLRALGVGLEDPVALVMERSAQMIVALLGILKAGGAYVPLDPSYPRERLEWMLEDSGAKVIVTEERWLPILPSQYAKPVCLDTDRELIGQQPAAPLPDTGGSGRLAYLIYTSGSTGRPKAVAVSHQAVLRLVCGSRFVDMGSQQVFLLLTAITFDVSAFEIWGSLLNGGRLVVPPPQAPSLDELELLLEQHRVSTLWLTGGFFNLVVDERPSALRGVRQLLAGGEALSVPHVRRLLSEAPEVRFINGYGPTEGTIFTCCHVVEDESDLLSSVPIGRPLASTRVYVLGTDLMPVPVGVPGELYIGGDGLARSYWKRPELTAEQFVPDPFHSEPGRRLYRSGDLARWLPNGLVDFLGRIDQQVKIRGFRVELGEIETALIKHPEVERAVVTAPVGPDGNRRLVAYLVGRDGAAPQTEALPAFLRRTLPDYMVPSTYVILENLPLNASGKVDRNALPAPQMLQPRGEYVAPRGELESTIADVWCEVLELEKVGVHDNFFELGGHSLLIIRVHGRLQNALSRSFSAVDLFRYPTVSALAEYLSLGDGAGQAKIEQDAATRGESRKAATSRQQKNLSKRRTARNG